MVNRCCWEIAITSLVVCSFILTIYPLSSETRAYPCLNCLVWDSNQLELEHFGHNPASLTIRPRLLRSVHVLCIRRGNRAFNHPYKVSNYDSDSLQLWVALSLATRTCTRCWDLQSAMSLVNHESARHISMENLELAEHSVSCGEMTAREKWICYKKSQSKGLNNQNNPTKIKRLSLDFCGWEYFWRY